MSNIINNQNEKYPKLKEAIRVNNLDIRNRVVMPPMATATAVNGAPDENLIKYYEERAKATGLIILEHEYISDDGIANNNQLSMASDEVIPAYKKLTSAVHSHGAIIFSQINHAGCNAKFTERTIGPTNVAYREGVASPTPMTLEDINRIKNEFVSAAIRAKKAGFDGVEIHSAHGYLLCQFYSPITNLRTDEYTGKTLEGRTRLQCEVIKAVREAVGDDYPVAIRLGACDYMEGGSEKEDIPEACRKFEEAGVDLIDISGGLNGYTVQDVKTPGWFSDLSRLAKSKVRVPVIVTGGIRTPEDAEEILNRKDADMVGIGRTMIKNPTWTEEIYK